jgi:8-oxo-dGTP diphosphatase
MSETMKYPGVGTGVYIRKDGKVLFGRRRNGAKGEGLWCAPGGKLEMFEGWEANCIRETKEECGLDIENLRLMTVTDDPSPEYGTHFITLHFVADWAGGEPEDDPSEKVGEWGWYAWNQLPQRLFHPTRNFLKTGYNPLNF